MKFINFHSFFLIFLIFVACCLNFGQVAYAQDLVSVNRAKLGLCKNTKSTSSISVSLATSVQGDACDFDFNGIKDSLEQEKKISVTGIYCDIIEGGKIAVFSGGVTVIDGDMVFYASTVVHYLKDKVFYASGGVSISHPKFLISCDEIWVDIALDRAYAKNVRLILPQKSEKFSQELYLVFLSDRVGVDGDSIVAFDNKISASTIIPPNFYIDVPDFSVDENGDVVAENAILKLIGIPILYIPKLSLGSSGSGSVPVALDFGRKSYLGLFAKLKLRVGSYRGINNHLLLGVFQERGIGVGTFSNYRYENSLGSLKLYFINDNNDGRFLEKRYQIEFAHRTDFSLSSFLDELTFTTEIHRRSDYLVQRDFFRYQWLIEKEPHTYVNLQQSWDSSSISLFSQVRVNNYEHETEYFPEASWVIYGKQIGKYVFSLSSRLGYMRLEDNGATDTPDSLRAITVSSISRSFAIGNAIAVTPEIGFKGAFYGDPVADNDEARILGYSKVSISTRFVGKPFSSGEFRRRHVILAKAELLFTTNADDFPTEAIYDSEDIAYRDISLNLILTNVIEEKGNLEDKEDVSERFFFRLQNKMNFSSEAREIEGGGKPLGYLNGYLKWAIRDDIFFIGDFDLDWYDFGMQTAGMRVGYNISDTLSVEFGGRFFRDNEFFDSSDATDTEVVLRWEASQKWFYQAGYSRLFSSAFSENYDDISLTIHRRGRDFTISVTLGNNNEGAYASFSVFPSFLTRLSTRITRAGFQ